MSAGSAPMASDIPGYLPEAHARLLWGIDPHASDQWAPVEGTTYTPSATNIVAQLMNAVASNPYTAVTVYDPAPLISQATSAASALLNVTAAGIAPETLFSTYANSGIDKHASMMLTVLSGSIAALQTKRDVSPVSNWLAARAAIGEEWQSKHGSSIDQVIASLNALTTLDRHDNYLSAHDVVRGRWQSQFELAINSQITEVKSQIAAVVPVSQMSQFLGAAKAAWNTHFASTRLSAAIDDLVEAQETAAYTGYLARRNRIRGQFAAINGIGNSALAVALALEDADFNNQSTAIRAEAVYKQLADETAFVQQTAKDMVQMLLVAAEQKREAAALSVQSAQIGTKLVSRGVAAIASELSDNKNSLTAAGNLEVESGKADGAFESVGEGLITAGHAASAQLASDSARMEMEQALKKVEYVVAATNDMLRLFSLKMDMSKIGTVTVMDAAKMDIEGKSNHILQQVQMKEGEASWSLDKFSDVGTFIGALSGTPSVQRQPSKVQQAFSAVTSVAGLGLSIASMFV